MDIIDLTTERKICLYPDAVALTSSQFNFPLLTVVKNQISLIFISLKYVPDHFKFY